MSHRIGSHIVGSAEWETLGSQESNTINIANYGENRLGFFKMMILNQNQDCTVNINDQGDIFVPQGRGFVTNERDVVIRTLKITNAGTDTLKYCWAGGYS